MSTHAETFLDSTTDPDCSKNARVLERADADLDVFVASTRQNQRHLTINADLNRQSRKRLISHSQSIVLPNNRHSKSERKSTDCPPGIEIGLHSCTDERRMVHIPSE